MVNGEAGMIDYEMELIKTGLEMGQPDAYARWQAAVEVARDKWQLERAWRLFRLIKRYSMYREEQSVYHLEGTLLVNMLEWSRALAAYERALAINRAVGNRHGQMLVMVSLAVLLRRRGQPLSDIVALYEQVRTIATELNDDENRMMILNGLGLAYYDQGLLTRARDCYLEVQSAVQGQPALEAAVRHNLGSVAWTQGKLDEAEAHFRASLPLLELLGDQHGVAETLNSLGLIQEGRGDWHEAAASYEQSLALFQKDGDWYGEAQALTNLGHLIWLLGDASRSLALHEEALALAEEAGDLAFSGQVLTGLGDSYVTLGRYAEAEAAFRRALAVKIEAGAERSLKHTYLSLGILYQTQRQWAEAQQAYEQALAYATAQQDTRLEANLLVNLAQVALGEEEFAPAYRYLEAATPIAEQANYRDLLATISCTLGDLEVLKAQSDGPLLLRHYTEACAYASDFNEIILREVLDHLVGLWSAHAEEGGVTEACWFCESILTIWHRLGAAERQPLVIETFTKLKERLAC